MNAQDLAIALARTTLATTAACGLAWLLLAKLRIDSPRVHRLAWTLAILQGWLLFPWTLEIAARATPVSRDAVAARVHSPTAPISFIAGIYISPQTNRSHSLLDSPLLAAIPIAAWLAGAGALAAAGVYRYARVLRTLPLGSPPDDPAWRMEWRRQVEAVRIPSRRRVDLRMTTDLGPLLCWTPWTYLVLAPKTLWAALTSPERQSILRHELAHLQRGDLWKSLAIRVLALPQWFNPLTRLAVRRFDEAGEWACDDAAAGAAAGGPLAFANSLLHAAEFASAELPGSLAANGGVLSRRIHRLVTPRFKEESKMKRLVVPMLLLAVTVVQLIRVERVSAESAERSSNSVVEDASTIVDNAVVKTAAATEVAAERVKTFDDLAKLPYVIDPPDILLIEGVNLTPKSPHRLEKFDTVLIRVEGALPEQPIDNAYNVDADGAINFGPAYGRVSVVGLTVEESEAAIRDALSTTLSKVKVSASLLASESAQHISGQYLVQADGKVFLGSHGSVYVTGMTLEEARKAIERKLAEKLKDPEVVVDVLAYNSKVAYVIHEDAEGFGHVVRLPVPYPLSKDCNVGSALEQIGSRAYKLSEASIRLCRPEPNGVSAELALSIVYDSSTCLITPETNHPLLPGDRIFVTTPKVRSEGVKQTRFSPSAPPSFYAPAYPSAGPTPVGPAPTASAKSSADRSDAAVSFEITLIDDDKGRLNEFETLNSGFVIDETGVVQDALKVLEQNGLITRLSSPKLMAPLGVAARMQMGSPSSEVELTLSVCARETKEQLTVDIEVRHRKGGVTSSIDGPIQVKSGKTTILSGPATKSSGATAGGRKYLLLTPTLIR